jgi:hypothetical protein
MSTAKFSDPTVSGMTSHLLASGLSADVMAQKVASFLDRCATFKFLGGNRSKEEAEKRQHEMGMRSSRALKKGMST